VKPEDLVVGNFYALKEQQLVYAGCQKDSYFSNDWYKFTLAKPIELPEPLGSLTEITLWNNEIEELKEPDEKAKATH
jgi:hypothetical protein